MQWRFIRSKLTVKKRCYIIITLKHFAGAFSIFSFIQYINGCSVKPKQ